MRRQQWRRVAPWITALYNTPKYREQNATVRPNMLLCLLNICSYTMWWHDVTLCLLRLHSPCFGCLTSDPIHLYVVYFLFSYIYVSNNVINEG